MRVFGAKFQAVAFEHAEMYFQGEAIRPVSLTEAVEISASKQVFHHLWVAVATHKCLIP